MKLKNNFIVKFAVALFLIGIIFGVIFFFVFKPDLSGYLDSFKGLLMTSHQNTFPSSLILISCVFVLSISIVGVPIIAFYLFYEGLSIGFTFGAFFSIYQLKGLIFYTLFLLVSKLIFLIIMLYFVIFSLRYTIKFIDSIVSKNREELYKTIVYHFYRYLIVLVVVLINCTLIYFFGNLLVNLFIHLI